MKLLLPCALAATSLILGGKWSSAQSLSLEPNARICLIGNTMADRMQHDGWLEAYFHWLFPQSQFVFRDLGFSADTITTRLRSAGFGSPDEHLRRLRADVVLMMFGFNESFAGDAGAAQFEADLGAEIKRLLRQQYNGHSPPSLVLISPTPVQNADVHGTYLPFLRPLAANRVADLNRQLAPYVSIMRRVAEENQIVFIDLFTVPAIEQQESNDSRFSTINGIHLTDEGNRLIAESICRALFPSAWESENGRDTERLNAIRDRVRDKNFCWFHRYRTTDGYSIFGARGELEFVDRQTNRVVMERELEVLEAMAANRDAAIWAAARGEAYVVDDSNTPPFLEVISNIPGPKPDGSHEFLSGEEAISKMRVLDGFKVSLFAAEAEFPELVNPVQMAFDTQGRLWVAVWPSYPHWKPKESMNDKLLILEDTNGDGRADSCTVFADGLHNPTGFEFYAGGVLVAQVPDLLFLQDTDGDGRCDVRQRILHGLDSADTHHSANSFVLGPDGALYFQEGVFHRTQVETLFGPVRNLDAACYRFEPRSGRLEVYASYPFANPHGHVFDLWGRDIIHDGTGSQPYDGALISSRLDFPAKHAGAPQVYPQRTRPCPATEFVSAGNFPDSMVGELLVQNVIGDLGILRYRIDEQGGSLNGTELEPLLLSSDRNFRPVDLEFAPDGALYFIDWHNPIIGHMQHNLRDPNRDRAHGRVYRITHRDRPLVVQASESQMATPDLLERLCSGDARSRYRARIELSSRHAVEVVTEARRLASQWDAQRPEDAPKLLELLWVHQQFGVIHPELLDQLLVCPDHRVRAAAVRVLTDWRHELTDVDSWWLRAAQDDHPRVRLLAARGASYLPGPLGAKILAIVAANGRDRFIDYMLRESLRGIESNWRSAMKDAEWIAQLPAEGAAFLARQLTPDEQATMALAPAVARFLVVSPGLTSAKRIEALQLLAQNRGETTAALLLELIRETAEMPQSETSVYELVRLIPLLDGRGFDRNVLSEWAESSPHAALRQAGLLGIISITGNPDLAYELVLRDPRRFRDLAALVHLLPKAEWQWALFPHLVEAAQDPRPDWMNRLDGTGFGMAQFVRIELPGEQRILTLAEVEILADGHNVALGGTASQSSVGYGGEAQRAIDGNRSGRYGDGGQTHTAETTANPWWEVRLAAPANIDTIRIFNRTEGEFYRRLDGFTLSVLDDQRQILFEKRDLPARRERQDLAIALMLPEEVIRCAAIKALSQVVGREDQAFAVCARIATNEAPGAVWKEAIAGLARTAPAVRDTGDVGPLVDRLLTQIENTPLKERAHGVSGLAIQVVQELLAHLSSEQALAARTRLGNVVVREYHLGTKPHRMTFDLTKLVVAAGRPFELVLENTDLMPHNWVLVAPGRLEEVGELAEAESAQPDALGRQFIPDSPHVLAASRLLQPQESLRISMVAPEIPGMYPYVCTYPGHWRRMFGALIVVPSVEAYQADSESYLAALGLEIRDPLLLTINRPQTEWQLADLVPAVEADFGSGRDFDNGRQMFKLASCFSCHRLRDEGFALGPDLAAMPAEWTPTDVLSHIIEPSLKIDEKFQTQIFQMVSGNTISGIVVDEDDESVRIVENPLLEASATVLSKDDLDARRRSDVSIMPKGLLDSLSKEEILDLLAFLMAHGEPNHPVFSGK